MKIDLCIPTFWHRSINFGDQLTPYLVLKITSKNAIYTEQTQNITTVMVTGSILSTDVSNSIIWGCGYAWYDEAVNKPLEVRAVRGKLTREKLLANGYDCPEVYGDPSLLLPRYFSPQKSGTHRLGIIPHIIDYEQAKEMYSNEDNIIIIDLRNPIEDVISEINQCEKTISSSLHGLIVSHAYGIDSMWCEFSDKVIGDGFKFHDYFSSVNMAKYKPLDLRNYIPVSKIISKIPNEKITFDADLLYNSCPLI